MFERLECAFPELVEPAPQFAEAVGIDAIHAACPFSLIDHETRLLQCFEMLRDGGAAHRQPGGNDAHRSRPVAQALEHGAASRVGEGCQSYIVSHYLP